MPLTKAEKAAARSAEYWKGDVFGRVAPGGKWLL